MHKLKQLKLMVLVSPLHLLLNSCIGYSNPGQLKELKVADYPTFDS
jgi:hypothetical protein